MKYKVRFYQDNIYEVIEYCPEFDIFEKSVFQGTLSDCEFWIRLKEEDYL